jgi:transposase
MTSENFCFYNQIRKKSREQVTWKLEKIIQGDSLITTTTITQVVGRMTHIELQQYTISEEKAEEYLQAQGILQQFDQCPYCENTRIGRVRCGKYKCYRCRKEWGPRRGSILEGLRVPLVRVLIAIKLFELDTSVREAAHPVGLSYNTVYDLFDLFR